MNKGEMEADQAEKDADKIRDVEATIEGVSDVSQLRHQFFKLSSMTSPQPHRSQLNVLVFPCYCIML